jgi:TrmH family RNA methyltransferase
MGTILRTANWFGINFVYLSPECVDIYNSKVLRAGMGAHFHTTIVPNFSIDAIKKSGYTIVGADQNGIPIGVFDKKSALPICIVLGSEAHGISDHIKPYVEHYVSVPGKGEIDSLNVTVAGGILLHYFTK